MKYFYTFVYKSKAEKFSDSDKDRLFLKVAEFMAIHQITYNASDLKLQIERQNIKSMLPKKISLLEAVTGATALIKYATGSVVSEEELNRRANICSSCTLRTDIGGCQACGASATVTKFINNFKSQRRIEAPIPSSIKASFCSVCDCSLALMAVTRYADLTQEPEEKNSKRPDYCWLKKDSINYTNE